MERADVAYAPFYCEENVWHLSRDPRVPDGRRSVVFVSNANRTVAMWGQRAAPAPRSPALWDYHVLLVVESAHGALALDLDTLAGFPLPLERYLAATFPFGHRVDPRLWPRFRILEAAEWRRRFASDRSHMRRGDDWSEPPPPWPPIQAPGQRMNLFEFVDTEAPEPGTVVDLDGLRRRFC